MSIIGTLFHHPRHDHQPVSPVECGDLIRWDDSFSVGNALIDSEHQDIIHYLNLLYRDWISGAHALNLHDVWVKLFARISTHFANEEDILIANNCPTLTEHQAEHQQMLSELCQLGYDLDSNQLSEQRMTRFLRHVVVDHVLGFDQELRAYMRH